jgi:hypothetical protein
VRLILTVHGDHSAETAALNESLIQTARSARISQTGADTLEVDAEPHDLWAVAHALRSWFRTRRSDEAVTIRIDNGRTVEVRSGDFDAVVPPFFAELAERPGRGGVQYSSGDSFLPSRPDTAVDQAPPGPDFDDD